MKTTVGELKQIIREERARLQSLNEDSRVSPKKVNAVYRHMKGKFAGEMSDLGDAVVDAMSDELGIDEDSVYSAADSLESAFQDAIKRFINRVAGNQLKAVSVKDKK